MIIIDNLLAFFGKILYFTSYFNNKGNFPKPLSSEEEAICIKLMQEGDVSAREKLIRHNLRLVVHIVKKYSNSAEADDLISVGTIGLIKGIETFKPSKGCQLATYAARCIDNEVLMYLRTNKKHKGTLSLFDPVGNDKEGNDITLMDIIPLDENIFQNIENKVITLEIIEKMKVILNERETKIICLRYGINSKQMTQLEVSKKLNISRSYVSRIEKKAIKKIYDHFYQKK